MNRRLTILMCADLVGYSALMGQDEALAVQSVRDLKKKLFEPIAANHGGEVLKRMGDGWIVSFPGVEAALNCAEEVQNDLVDHEVIKLRIGCHIGEIVEDEDDFYGNGVNIAQRIETEAPPGGVMFSEDLFRQLSESRQKELSDAGVFTLKNIATPMRLYQWRPANLATAPEADTLPSLGYEAFTFAPDDVDTAAIAEDLHDGLVQSAMKRTGIKTVNSAADPKTPTTYLVRGRLRVAGARARFVMTLIRREDMETIWSETYQGSTEDVFAFTDNVVVKADNDLRLQTIQRDGDRLAHLSDDQLSVSELRTRAAMMFFRQTHEGNDRGRALLERAIELSPQDGMSRAMRAQSNITRAAHEFDTIDADFIAARVEDIEIAVENLPKSDYAYWVLGQVRLLMQNDIDGARSAMQESWKMNPSFIGTNDLKFQIALRTGAFDEAMAVIDQMKADGMIEQFRINRMCQEAMTLLAMGDAGGAARVASEAASLKSSDRGLHLLKALTCREAGDEAGLEAARAACARLDKHPSLVLSHQPLPDAFNWINKALHPDADPV